MKECEKIKKIRKSLNLTQCDIAKKLDVSKQYISSVERGITELSKEKAVLLCNKYDISADWLLRNKGKMKFKASDAGNNEIQNEINNEENKEIKITENVVEEKQPENALTAEVFSPCIGLFSSYIKTVFSVLDENGLRANIDDKLMAAAALFFNDFIFKNIPLDEADAFLEQFETVVKDSDEFKDRILKEYYNNYIENRK